MKKSASGALVTRIRPSAPMPRCRSQIAAMTPGSSDRRPSTSSIRTKSFPVPLYFPNRISGRVIEVLHELVDQRHGTAFAGVEPPDARVAPEPRHLAPGQLAGPLRDPLGRFIQGDRTRHVLDGFSV